MKKTICNLDCDQCENQKGCPGCEVIGGEGKCVISACAGRSTCESCRPFDHPCGMKQKMIEEFNLLGIEGMPEVTDLTALPGHFINLEYTLPSGQKIKLWDDKRIYFGWQLEKKNSDRCYGLTADENYLLVCEYGKDGADPEIVAYRKRGKSC